MFLVEALARSATDSLALFDASNKMSISWMSSWSFAMGVGGGFVAREPGGERIVSLPFLVLGSPLPSWERLDAEPSVGGRPQLPLVLSPTSGTACF